MSWKNSKSGLYKILNKENGKFYIGSSNDLDERKCSHFSDLRGGRHGNIHMQRVYNKTPDVFEFIILEEILEENLLIEEQKLLNENWDGGKNCYNISKNASSPMLGLKHSEETKQAISIFFKNKPKKPFTTEHKKNLSLSRTGDKNFNYGKKFGPRSEETKKKLSESNKGQKHVYFGVTGSNHPAFGFKQSSEQKEKSRIRMLEYWKNKKTESK